ARPGALRRPARGRRQRLRRRPALVIDHTARSARGRGSSPALRRPHRDRWRRLPHSGRACPRPRAAGLDRRSEARMTATKLKIDIDHDIVAMMAAEVAAGERAVTTAMREAGTG